MIRIMKKHDVTEAKLGLYSLATDAGEFLRTVDAKKWLKENGVEGVEYLIVSVRGNVCLETERFVRIISVSDADN